MAPDNQTILAFFKGLHADISASVRKLDPQIGETSDSWERPGGGGGLTRVFENGSIIEKGGVNFSHVMGERLPASATRQRPQLANQPFEAMGVSVVFHPRNPFVPTTHMNVRFFSTRAAKAEDSAWWFGGGFDLTPYYPFLEDAIHWHKCARGACDSFGEELYPRFKTACDTYFFLPHRGETRGIGGIFFDDFNELGPEASFSLSRAVGEAFFPAWQAVVQRRKDIPFTEHHRQFQAYRRGRYVEFNLIHDRGTLFGLQSGGRTESILMSLPPRADWIYAYNPQPQSPEAKLYEEFLRPRDWLHLKD
jgi:coproporphyrinogen III oxidase